MRVFIAGASGVLGRRLVRLLAGRGHDVRGLARSPAAEETVRQAGGTPARADLFDAASLTKAAEGAETILHVATSIPQKARTSPGDFALNDRIRREGTRALLEACRAVGARRFVFQSIVWAARPADGSPFDESSPPPHVDPIAESALDGERLVAEAGFSTLRCGWFYGADASTSGLAAALRQRRLPLYGGGRAQLSFLHLDDAASAFAVAAERAVPGLWHVVDREPASTSDFFRGLASRIGAPEPRNLPIWLARIAAGRDAVRFLCTPMVTTGTRFSTDFGWIPAYPTFREGLDQTVSEWAHRPP